MANFIVPRCTVVKTEQEYLTSGIKENSLKELADPLFRDGLRIVNQAFEEYSRDVNHQTYAALAVAVLNTLMDDTILVFTPYFDDKANLGRTTPSKVQTSMGQCYVVCTTPEEAALCPDKFCIMMSTNEIISKAHKDEDANGVCINPYGEHPCLITREHLLILIKSMQDPVEPDNSAPEENKTGDQPLTIEKLKSEKELIEKQLEYALARFYENPSKETVYKIMDAVTLAYVYNLNAVCPMDFNGKDLLYNLYRTPENGFARIVCTPGDKGIDKLPEKLLIFIAWRGILSQAANARGIMGIVINPYSGHRAIACLNQENIRMIIQQAEDTINGLPDDIREEVRKGI